jgi:hypothetical protein
MSRYTFSSVRRMGKGRMGKKSKLLLAMLAKSRGAWENTMCSVLGF